MHFQFEGKSIKNIYQIKKYKYEREHKITYLLNSLLADELAAINQYMLHPEMCENCTKPINTSILINK